MDKKIENMSDEEKLEYLEKTEWGNDDLLGEETVDIIKAIDSDDIKIEAMNRYFSETNRFSYQTDTEHQRTTKEGAKEGNKVDIILTLKSDEKKLEFYNLIASEAGQEYNKARILASLKDDKWKIEMLNRDGVFSKEGSRAVLIAGLSDDATKLEYLETVKAGYARAEIIASLEDDDKKSELLDTVSSKQDKDIIIKSMQKEESEHQEVDIEENEPIDPEMPGTDELEQETPEEEQDLEISTEKEGDKSEQEIGSSTKLSLEELMKRAEQLDKKIEENDKVIDELDQVVNEETRKQQLIDIIKSKEAKVQVQERKIALLTTRIKELQRQEQLQEKEDNKDETEIGE